MSLVTILWIAIAVLSIALIIAILIIVLQRKALNGARKQLQYSSWHWHSD